MNKLNLQTEAQMQEWLTKLNIRNEKILRGEISFDRRDLIPEDDLAKDLQVSHRTMRTYRKKKYFHCIKLEGRIYYRRNILYFDLLNLSEKSVLG